MQVSEHDMLRLDDEMAGLIEAADASAGQDETHSMKPVATSSVPGELAGAHVMSAAALAGTLQTRDKLVNHRAEQC